MQQTNRVLEIKSKVYVIGDMNQSKVNKKTQMQGNASSVAPLILTIELNIQRPVKLALNVANKDTLPLSVRKRIESRVGQDMQKVVSQHVGQYQILVSLSLSLNVLELLVVTWANTLSWYLPHFTPSTALSSELNLTRGNIECYVIY